MHCQRYVLTAAVMLIVNCRQDGCPGQTKKSKQSVSEDLLGAIPQPVGTKPRCIESVLVVCSELSKGHLCFKGFSFKLSPSFLQAPQSIDELCALFHYVTVCSVVACVYVVVHVIQTVWSMWTEQSLKKVKRFCSLDPMHCLAEQMKLLWNSSHARNFNVFISYTQLYMKIVVKYLHKHMQMLYRIIGTLHKHHQISCIKCITHRVKKISLSIQTTRFQ